MTICYITTVHYRYDTRVYLKLAKYFANIGYNVVLIVADGLGDITSGSLKIIDVGKPKSRFFRVLKQIKVLYKLLRLGHFDNYHLHDPELLFLGIILKCTGLKVIYDVHELVYFDILEKDWIHNQKLRKYVARLYNIIEHICFNLFDFIILAEEGYKNYYFPKYSKYINKFIIVRNFPIQDENTVRIKTKRISGESLKLIYVGSISANRGILEVIRSLSLVSKPVIFKIIGRWEDSHFFDKCKNEPNWKYIEYVGHIKSSEVGEHIAQADIGICTLHPEKNYLFTMPVKSFEYMVNGLPIIMSDFPFWKEFYKDFALFANPCNVESIACTINTIIMDDYLFQKLSNNVLNKVEQFRWENEANNLLRYYIL